jgi:excinuclease UvrABC nuclease subunit
MLKAAATVKFHQTDSVLEALILEANLIKKHQPPYNTREKDNKSFNYLIITREDFPRVLVVRGRDLFDRWGDKKIKFLFGPFPSGGALKEGMKIIRKIFPFRDTCDPKSTKPCFNRQIGLCPGVCSGEVSSKEYGRLIRNIQLLLNGKKGKLVAQLEREMKKLATDEEFERAADVRRQIFALLHIRETALLGDDYKVSRGGDVVRVEGFDVAHISETARVGVLVVIENGEAKKSAYRKFNIRTKKKGDVAALEEILRRRFSHAKWQLPHVIVIDGGTAQKNAALRVMAEFGFKIPLVHVIKNARHTAGKIVGNDALVKKIERDILRANTEAHRFAISFHRQQRRKAFLA